MSIDAKNDMALSVWEHNIQRLTPIDFQTITDKPPQNPGEEDPNIRFHHNHELKNIQIIKNPGPQKHQIEHQWEEKLLPGTKSGSQF